MPANMPGIHISARFLQQQKGAPFSRWKIRAEITLLRCCEDRRKSISPLGDNWQNLLIPPSADFHLGRIQRDGEVPQNFASHHRSDADSAIRQSCPGFQPPQYKNATLLMPWVGSWTGLCGHWRRLYWF
jgi:hypothetical protein